MISVIIINYNTFEITSNCIRSILDNTVGVDFEIILVDNASTEKNPEEFKKYFPNIILIKNNSNVGFAKGNNIGIHHALGDIILLLNSDTLFTENVLLKAFDKIISIPKIGFLGVKMVYPNGSLQYTARRFRSIGWELLDLFRFVPYFMPYVKRAKLMQGKYFKGDFDMDCDWLNGAFLMFKKAVLQSLPNHQLDDRFFMYGEDHLWGYQLNELGYINYFFAGTSIVHINNASTLPSKRIKLLQTMFKHELEIMQTRKGRGVYYYLFCLIFGLKEQSRILIKKIL